MKKDIRNSSRFTLLTSRMNQNLFSILLVLLIILLLNRVKFIFVPFEEFFSIIVFPIVATFILYYVMKPLVAFLERKKVSRGLSISLIFLIFIGLLVLLSWTIYPVVYAQVDSFARTLPDNIRELTAQTERLFNSNLMRPFRNTAMEQISRLNQYLQEYGSHLSTSVLDSMSSFFTAAERTLLGLIILPFMLFYLLKDDSKILPAILPKLPIAWRKESESSIREIHQKLSSYIRGQLIIGVLVSVLLTIGFLIVGLPYGTTLAILAGFMNFLIPSFGALIIAVPACLIGFIHSPWTALWVAIIFYVVQHVQSHLVAPLVLSNQLQIHPLTILVLLIGGGKVFGFIGLILVIPVYAAIRVIVQHSFRWYQNTSGYYDEENKEMEE